MDYVITVIVTGGEARAVITGPPPDGIYVICGNDSLRRKPIYLDRYTLDGDPVRAATSTSVKRG